MLSRSIAPVLALTLLGGAPLATSAKAATAPEPLPAGVCAPFDDPGNIAAVHPYKVIVTNVKRSASHLEGAVVHVPARPGMTREWLQRIVDDPASRSVPDCPMSVEGATARVTSAGSGFDVTVRSPERDNAKEVLRRAQALMPAQVTHSR